MVHESLQRSFWLAQDHVINFKEKWFLDIKLREQLLTLVLGTALKFPACFSHLLFSTYRALISWIKGYRYS